MKTAVIYARYSSESQNEQSIEGQLRVCQQYAKNNSILIVDTYIDRAMTGTNDLRPAFQKMIRDSAKHQWDFVIVYKLDRFSRDKYEATIHKHTLKENGVKLVSAMENIPDTPEGIILEALLEGMNQYYSAELSQKVRRGLKESWLKGNFSGGIVPYGYYVVEKKYKLHEVEAHIVKEMFEKYAQGFTAVSIAQELRQRGIRTRKGEYFSVKSIYTILRNIKYTGKVTYGGQEYTNIIPPIISEEIWRKVQEIHGNNKHSPGQKKDIFEFILSGKLVCGDCKRLMVGESGTSKTGDKHYYYTCLSRRRRKEPCQQKSIPKQYLEDIVINATLSFLLDDNAVKLIAEKIHQFHEKESKVNSNLQDLEIKHKTAMKAADNLIRAIEQGIITEQTKIRLKELEAQISGLEFDIEQEKQRSYTYLTVEMIENFLHSLASGKIDNVKARTALVKSFIREIILYPVKIIITYNFTDAYEKHNISPDAIKEIERQSKQKTTALSLPSSSYKLSSSAP